MVKRVRAGQLDYEEPGWMGQGGRGRKRGRGPKRKPPPIQVPDEKDEEDLYEKWVGIEDLLEADEESPPTRDDAVSMVRHAETEIERWKVELRYNEGILQFIEDRRRAGDIAPGDARKEQDAAGRAIQASANLEHWTEELRAWRSHLRDLQGRGRRKGRRGRRRGRR